MHSGLFARRDGKDNFHDGAGPMSWLAVALSIRNESRWFG
jgi:hypothetical protein